jgi:hypothetical protein
MYERVFEHTLCRPVPFSKSRRGSAQALIRPREGVYAFTPCSHKRGNSGESTGRNSHVLNLLLQVI